MTPSDVRSQRYLLIRLLFLAVALVLSAGCSSDSPNLGVPTDGSLPRPGDIGGGGADGLRQELSLDGQYAGSVRLEGSWSASGPGQEVAVTFVAVDLVGVKQFEFLVEPNPAAAFDLEGASFTTDSPFITLPGGVRLDDDGRMRLGGASLASPVSGTQGLGTLTLSTSATFSAAANAELRVVLVSLGPTSTQRDTYEGDDLGLGVEVR